MDDPRDPHELQNRVEALRKPGKCPACGFSPMATILWGMPAFSPGLERDLEAGRVTLGGCCVSDDDPAWECSRCGQKIHRKRANSERRKKCARPGTYLKS